MTNTVIVRQRYCLLNGSFLPSRLLGQWSWCAVPGFSLPLLLCWPLWISVRLMIIMLWGKIDSEPGGLEFCPASHGLLDNKVWGNKWSPGNTATEMKWAMMVMVMVMNTRIVFISSQPSWGRSILDNKIWGCLLHSINKPIWGTNIVPNRVLGTRHPDRNKTMFELKEYLI